MYLKQIFLAVVGTSFGVFAAGGVFTVLISVGLIPRFAGKLHVSRKVFLFEEAVVCGVIAGTFFSVFDRYGRIGEFVRDSRLLGSATDVVWEGIGTAVIMIFGLFAGIFVGCLAWTWHRGAVHCVGKGGRKLSLFYKSGVSARRGIRERSVGAFYACSGIHG